MCGLLSVLSRVHITMWESNTFECLVEESPPKNRDASSKSPAKHGCPCQQRMLRKVEKELIISKIESFRCSILQLPYC